MGVQHIIVLIFKKKIQINSFIINYIDFEIGQTIGAVLWQIINLQKKDPAKL